MKCFDAALSPFAMIKLLQLLVDNFGGEFTGRGRHFDDKLVLLLIFKVLLVASLVRLQSYGNAF